MGTVLPNRERHYSRASSCDGKRKYATNGAALLAAQASERGMVRHRGKKAAKAINVYQCRFCNLWHLTRSAT